MAQHNYATVNGVRLHYVSEGQGKLLLFLHGFPEFWYEWKDQLAEFGRDHLAVAPDLRGYNLSERPAAVEQYAITQLVEDVRALAEQFVGQDTFTLIAHDWGGGVAWAFALRYPERLERLIIINMAHPGTFDREMKRNPAQQAASQYMLLFRSADAEATLSAENYAGFAGRILGPLVKSGHFSEADRAAYLAAWSRPGGLTGGLNYYRAARVGPPAPGSPANGNYAIDPTALTVKVPTLVIWGEQDTALLTSNLDGLDQYVPQLTLKRIPDGSHWVIHEQPALVNGYIRAFLGG